MDKPNFSGEWHFNSAKSTLQLSPPDYLIMKIDHQGPRFTLQRSYLWDGENDDWEITLMIGGKESVHKDGPQVLYCVLFDECSN